MIADVIEQPGFDAESLEVFAAAYPARHARLRHSLAGHPLFSRAGLRALAERLPADRIEYNAGKLPLGIRAEDTPANGLSITETIDGIDSNGSWMVLKNIERDPAYARLLDALLAEIDGIVRANTGPMLKREAFLFLSSPGSVTPFHMDPEHNILLQIEGEKTMTVFPAGDERLVPAERSEDFHHGGHRNLCWSDGFADAGEAVTLHAGDAILVPVKAPHHVRNGARVSISFSITWRSDRSVAESELNSLNAELRALRPPVSPVGPQPERRHVRRFAYRLMRKLGV